MQIEYIDRVSITKDESEQLRRAGVSLDDWDYMLIIPADELSYYEACGETVYEPKGFYIEQMLRGCANNIWHKVQFRGEIRGVGVAYHD